MGEVTFSMLIIDVPEQSFVLLASQDPVLQQILIVAIPPGAQAELVPMHSA